MADNVSTLATNAENTNQNINSLTEAVTTGFAKIDGRLQEHDKCLAKYDQHLEKHDTDIGTIKATLDQLTTSAKKHWGDFTGSRSVPEAATPHPMPAQLFVADSPSIASLSLQSVEEGKAMEWIELCDLTMEKPNYLMEGLHALLKPGVDLDNHPLLTQLQAKYLKDIRHNLRGSPLVSLKKDLSAEDFIVMKSHVGSLTQLESLTAFVNQLESSILVVPNPQNPHDAVFILPGDIDVFTADEFLPAVAGVDVVVDMMGDDDNVMILARNSEAAVPVMTALFQLAAKGSTKTLELEASYKDDQKRGKYIPLPLPPDLRAFELSGSFELSLQAFSVTTVGQATILGKYFNSVLFRGCSMNDPSLVRVFGDHITSKRVSFSGNGLVAPADSLVKLFQHVFQHNNELKLVFDEKSLENLPEAVLLEIAKYLVNAWQTSKNLSLELEIDVGAFSGGNPFQRVVKAVLEQTHPRFNIVTLVEEGVFPKSSGITGSKSKKTTFAKKVKEWLASFGRTSPSKKRKDAPGGETRTSNPNSDSTENTWVPSTPLPKAPRQD